MKRMLAAALFLIISLTAATRAHAVPDDGVDKAYHAGAGIVAYSAGDAAAYGLGFPYPERVIAGFLTATATGIAKEMWDSRQRGGKFDAFDALATVGGGGVAALVEYSSVRVRPYFDQKGKGGGINVTVVF